MPALRIGFDGHAFDSPAGGVRRYVHELTRALLDSDPSLQVAAIGVRAGAALPAGVQRIDERGWLPTNLGWSLDGLPRAVRASRVDVFHAPAYTAPLWGVHPLVLTIHDVSYERHPEWYPYRSGRLRRAFYRRSALAADLVITDSEFSRREIEAAYGLPAERVRVIPLGVGPPFAAAPATRPNDGPPIILHVGDLHPRRNVGLLLDALAMLRGQGGRLGSTELVLAGVDRGSGSPLVARANELGIGAAVRFVAGADDDTVVTLMKSASVFAYPSLYEGFGLPVLEAMACGTPVVSSNAASMPEVTGDAAVLVDPADVRGWHEALVAILSSPERADAMRAAGLARAAALSWQHTARETLSVYRELASARSSDQVRNRA